MLWFAVALSLGWLALVGLARFCSCRRRWPRFRDDAPAADRRCAVPARADLAWWCFRNCAKPAICAPRLRRCAPRWTSLRRPAPPPRRDAAAATLGPSIRFGPGACGWPISGRRRRSRRGRGRSICRRPRTTEPLPVATLIAALSFPRDETDRDGFRALERALGRPGDGAGDPRGRGRSDAACPGRCLCRGPRYPRGLARSVAALCAANAVAGRRARPG
jgi:hypothetical protein